MRGGPNAPRLPQIFSNKGAGGTRLKVVLCQRTISPSSPSLHNTTYKSSQDGVHRQLTMITGLAHVNLTVPSGTLDQANDFYGETLGLIRRPVPQLQKDRLAWFDIGSSGQQIHIAFGDSGPESSRHPCFRIESPEKLLELQRRVWAHYEKGEKGSPKAADKPGEENSGTLTRFCLSGPVHLPRSLTDRLPCSGSKGVEYPQRFFARDYAGNRLEFSL